ncbi:MULTISPECIES: Gp49 family protein [unclassified Acinetobacter]|uniref:Gp49 family protein n=1 Tax=unclassified Acinetobacter TaxID=196816 RepID=UPI0015D41A7C|nr:MULTISPECIES: Gp49 family protein [unclassified Acinetobacter]
MSNTEQQIEQEIQDKGLTAPRLTPDHIDAQITGEQYFVFPGTTVTICLLTLLNGFTVTGESACASPENFDEEIGRKIARDQARDKIWLLEGYLLKDKLHSGKSFKAACGDNCTSSQVHNPGSSFKSSGSLTFGDAITALKQGQRVARSGWNGKGMFLYYVPENKYPAARNTLNTLDGLFEDNMVPYGAYIAMKTAQNNVVPWLASQTDVLAEDWVVIS